MTSLDGGQHYPFDLRNLPLGWSASLIKDLVTELRPGFPNGDHNKSGTGVAHLRPMNIDRDGRLDLSDVKYVADAKPQRVEVGDVLFNNTNSPALIGKTTAITQEGDFAYSNHMTRLRLRPGVASVFIARQLHYLWMSGYFRHRCVNHVNQASIGTTALSDTVPLLLPPLPEQRRIVAKIEELFSDLDAGVAALERVRANLKRYRAAVLKAAVEGRLTEEWRKRNPAAEPAAKLLERILAERRAKWEQDQLRKFKEAGKTPPKGWKERFKLPAVPDPSSLSGIPPGWLWASMEQVSAEIVDCPHSTAKFVPEGLPCLDTTCIDPGRVLHEHLRFVDQSTFTQRIARLEPRPGDIVFAREGTVGTAVALPRGFCCCLGQRVMLFRPGEGTLPKFIECALNSDVVRQQYRPLILGTTAPHLNVADARVLAVPLPPAAEQAEIVAEVDRRLSVADAAETQVEHAVQRAARLRQAILKRAFDGKLVPQDPADEPAAIMLERGKAPTNGHRAVIETNGESRRAAGAKRRSRARA